MIFMKGKQTLSILSDLSYEIGDRVCFFGGEPKLKKSDDPRYDFVYDGLEVIMGGTVTEIREDGNIIVMD